VATVDIEEVAVPEHHTPDYMLGKAIRTEIRR